MNETVQSMQVKGLLTKAAEERDHARAVAMKLEFMWRKERAWNRIFGLLVIALALALVMTLGR